jgi:hypothetical protein
MDEKYAGREHHVRRFDDLIIILAHTGHDRMPNQFFNSLFFPVVYGAVGIYHDGNYIEILKSIVNSCNNKSRHHIELYGHSACINDINWSTGDTELLSYINKSEFEMKPLTFNLHIDALQAELRSFSDAVEEDGFLRQRFLADPVNNSCPQPHAFNQDSEEESVCSLCAGEKFNDKYRRRHLTESPGLKLLQNADSKITQTQEFVHPVHKDPLKDVKQDNPASPRVKRQKYIPSEIEQIEALRTKGYSADESCCFVCNVSVDITRQYCRKTYCENLGYFFVNGEFTSVSYL